VEFFPSAGYNGGRHAHAPEELARQQIDALLTQCGWLIQDYKKLDLSADGRTFTELYNGARGSGARWTSGPQGSRAGRRVINVQHLTSNKLDGVCRVTICTIQRLYAMLRSLWLNNRSRRGNAREETGHTWREFDDRVCRVLSSAVVSSISHVDHDRGFPTPRRQ
jgi:hypothetical protein